MKILVVNCGSSSIKYRLIQMPEGDVLAKGLIERIGEPQARHRVETAGSESSEEVAVADHQAGMALLLHSLANGPRPVLANVTEVAAVGHRVVHGGAEFTESAVVDADVENAIERCCELAPLHNPPNLVGIRAARQALPAAVQVACFDTAFHATLSPAAYVYALPYELYERFGIRRYGFHGTSHRFVAQRAAALLDAPLHEINCITLHLGNGCSAAAVRGGQSVDTSMGLTPLEGLVMGTRSGDFDPAILLFLAERGYDLPALNALCNKQAGLLGLSGASNDMRTVVDRARQGDRRAQLAFDVFAYRIKKYIGAFTAVLGRVDAIVFTGGIGEHSAEVRAASCRGLEPLGVELDDSRNAAVVNCEGEIQSATSAVKILVAATDEEAAIAADAYRLATAGKA